MTLFQLTSHKHDDANNDRNTDKYFNEKGVIKKISITARIVDSTEQFNLVT